METDELHEAFLACLADKSQRWTQAKIAKIIDCEPDSLYQYKSKKILGDDKLLASFGTIMANDVGMPLPELQVLMGHTSITVTMKYVRARGAGRWLADWNPGPGSGPAETGPEAK